jgi:hypothetical protein
MLSNTAGLFLPKKFNITTPKGNIMNTNNQNANVNKAEKLAEMKLMMKAAQETKTVKVVVGTVKAASFIGGLVAFGAAIMMAKDKYYPGQANQVTYDAPQTHLESNTEA